MDAERQSGQADGAPSQAGGTPLLRDSAPSQRRGTLRYRGWQRLRGQRAFQRERNVGVYRHSGAALVRILPPWEAGLPRDGEEGTAGETGSAEKSGCSGQPHPQHQYPQRQSDQERQHPQRQCASQHQSDQGQKHPQHRSDQGRREQYRPCRRLGVVASRKVGNAVVRNRAKRVWREIFRLNQQLLPAQCDVLVIVRKDFASVGRSELDALFADAARRARRAFGGEMR